MFIINPFRYAATGYTIKNAVWFDGSADYLHWTPGSPDSGTIGALSFWLKRGDLTRDQYVFRNTGTEFNFDIQADDTIYTKVNGGYTVTSEKLRDTGGWDHHVLRWNTTEATGTDRLTYERNGVEVTAYGGGDARSSIAQDSSAGWLDASKHWIGSTHVPSAFFNGYLAEVVSVDGVSTDTFGEFDDNGVWVPIDPSGLTFGTNGFWLDFAVAPGTGNGAGTDVSGNDNHFTDVSMTAAQQVTDSPTDSAADGIGNYPVMNPNDNGDTSDWTVSKGNLTVDVDIIGELNIRGTLGSGTSGKYYFEYLIVVAQANTARTNVGVALSTADINLKSTTSPQYNVAWQYDDYGDFSGDGASGAYGDTYGSGEVIGVALDLDNGNLFFSNEDVWQNSATEGEIEAGTGTNAASTAMAGLNVYPYIGHASGGGAAYQTTVTCRFDHADCTGTIPDGFKAWNTATLPTPTIPDPTKHHQVELVDHDGTSTAFTCNWDADVYDTLFIIKRRGDEKWYWVDGLNGYDKYMESNNNAQAQQTDANVISVSGTTITLGSTLASDDYVVECHKAGAAGGASLSGGGVQINSTASANTTSGFSIVNFVGTEVDGTVATGLSTACDFVINYNLGTGRLSPVYHSSTTYTKYHYLNSNASVYTDSDMWYAAPTPTLMGTGTHSNVSEDGNNHVMYCWYGVEGYSAFGSYEGNNDPDGTFINMNMSPASVNLKGIDTTAGWQHYTRVLSSNPTGSYEIWNETTSYDNTSNEIDILSNGVKMRDSDTDPNKAETYIYMAWGESPFGGSGVAQAKAR